MFLTKNLKNHILYITIYKMKNKISYLFFVLLVSETNFKERFNKIK